MRLSMRKRIVTFAAAVVAVHFAFYFPPRYSATRPAFDQEAYDKAVETLKAEVGSPAVDAGVFTIPKVPISCPYRGEAIVQGGEADVFLDIESAGGRLMYEPDDQAWTAAISREDARRIWDVISYLKLTRATGSTDIVRVNYVPALKFADRTWLKARVERVDDALSAGCAPASAAGCRAIARYIHALDRSKDIAWTHDNAVVESVLVSTLNRSIPQRSSGGGVHDMANALWLDAAETHLAWLASAKAAPFFRARIRAGRGYGDWAGRLPLVGRYLGPSNSIQVYSPWTWERLAGKPPDEQLAIASSAAFDPASPDKNEWYAAMRFLIGNRPDEFRERCIQFYQTQGLAGDTHNLQCLDCYQEVFPGDYSLVDILSRTPGFDDDPRALGKAYAITKKREYLDALMQYALRSPDCLTRSSDPAVARFAETLARERGMAKPFDIASEELALLYYSDRSLSEIPEFLFAHAPLAANGNFLFMALAQRRSAEDKRFLVSVAVGEAPEYSEVSKQVESRLRGNAIGALEGRRELLDNDTAGRLVDYLDGEPEPFADEAPFVNGIIRVLDGSKSQRAREFVEKVWAQDYDAYDRGGSVSYARLYNISRAEHNNLWRTRVLLNVRCSANPLDALLKMPSSERKSLAYQLDMALVDEYSSGDLERLLADEKYASICGHVYAALVARREKERRE